MSIIQTRAFRKDLLLGVTTWAVLHTVVLHQFGFSWKHASIDSLVSNGLLTGALLVVSIVIQFYNPQESRLSFIGGLCLMLCTVWLLSSRGLLMVLLPQEAEYDRFFSRSLWIRGMAGFWVLGCMALVCALWGTIHDRQEVEKRKAEAEKLAKEAELFNLRHQLQPHFLFNSLNSINALIAMKPQQARTMIQQLSDFLRGTLKKENNPWVSLQEELHQLHLYLEIEKVRFGHRLTAHIRNEAPEDTQLPTMILQPVMENAIKFGLYDTVGDISIHLEVKKQGDYLFISVQNPFDPQTSTPRKGTGFGLSSIQRRLYLLYGHHDLLQTTINDQLFITTIKIPIHVTGTDY